MTAKPLPEQNPQALLQRAVTLHQAGDFRSAIEGYTALLAAFPNDAQLLYLCGTALAQSGNGADAVRVLQRSLQIAPANPVARFNLGKALQDLGRAEEACQSYERALALKSDYAEAHFNQGRALRELSRPAEALAAYERVIALKPQYAPAHWHKGIVLHELQRLAEALGSLERAIKLKPDSAGTLVDLASVLHDLRREAQALDCLERVLALRPDYPEALLNKGSVLQDLGQLEAALHCIDRAIELKPEQAEAHFNRGDVLQDLRQFDAALACYDRAIELKPGFADAHWNKGLVALLNGDFAQGWPLYEWRAQGSKGSLGPRIDGVPLWLGDAPVAGKTVLIYAEQGSGDVVQFCRYLPQAEALGAKVVFEVPAAMRALISTLESGAQIIERGAPLPRVDLQCPLLSLPLAFRTTLETAPAAVPYLTADEARRDEWRRRLGPRRTMRIGIAWSGNPRHINDRNRSVAIERFRPLLERPFEFHSLQKECRDDDAPVLQALVASGALHEHRDALTDFAATAALIAELDLVIAVDTAVVHIAGALARPVWILLPFIPDFRWLLDRADSPWYPTATLFRQAKPGDWDSVFAQIGDKLNSMARAG